MKTIYFKYALSIAAFCMALMACDDAVEMDSKYKEDYLHSNKTPEYYQALREYKKSDHAITFGWFGNWTGVGASLASSMAGLPDSVDVISIWGNWRNTTPAQKADLKYIQEVKGTKAMMCFIVHDLGDQLTPSGQTAQEYWGWEGEFIPDRPYQRWVMIDMDVTSDQETIIRKYARQIADTIALYNYDGFDIDYEPNYQGRWGSLASYPKRMAVFVDELSRFIGPKSGTERLLAIDGEPQSIASSTGTCFDYFIVQAYQSTSYTDLDNRLKSTINNFAGILMPEEVAKKYVVTENFESYATNGGVNHTTRDGKIVNSLQGMAMWNPIVNGKTMRKGGVGTFHMEYEFTIPGLTGTYPYLRQATQIMNPNVE